PPPVPRGNREEVRHLPPPPAGYRRDAGKSLAARGRDQLAAEAMNRLALLSLGLLLVGGLALAAEPQQKFRLIELPELESLQKASPAATVFDANDTEFREKNGVIPGAKLLSSFDHYDLLKELPADKNAPLVFYCSNRL